MKKTTLSFYDRKEFEQEHGVKEIPVRSFTEEEFVDRYGFSPIDIANEEATTTKTLVIKYLLSNDDTWNLNISDYDPDKTDHELTAAAKAILAEAVFVPGGMDLVKVVSIEKVDRTKTPVTVD